MKTSSLNNVRKMYDTNADSYSKMMDSEIELPVYKDVLGRLHQQIANIPGILLDTSCGSGHMLAMYQSQFDSGRSLCGIDISTQMITESKKRLGRKASIEHGDMSILTGIDSGSVAAVINFFAVHHLEADGISTAMLEWNRVLVQNGRLLVAAWEGSGAIDYGEESDIIALRYTCEELTKIAEGARFTVTQCIVKPVEDFLMDAIYLECMKE